MLHPENPKAATYAEMEAVKLGVTEALAPHASGYLLDPEFGVAPAINRFALPGRTGMLVWDARTWKHTTFADAGEHAQPELGWALAREHWGQGYATEAASAVREWAYYERGLGRLVSLIAPANVRSERLAERLGCTRGETVDLWDTGPAVVWEHP